MHNSREPDNNWGLNPGSPEKVSASELRNIMSHLKEPLGTGSPRMNNTFRDTFPVKLRKLFNQMVILKEDRSSLPDGEGVVVVPDGRAGVGGPVAGVGPARRPVLVGIHGRDRRRSRRLRGWWAMRSRC